MARDDDEGGRIWRRLDKRLFGNTQHPATHNPKWRDLGERAGVRHRHCRHCSHLEFQNRLGRWVAETTCRHTTTRRRP